MAANNPVRSYKLSGDEVFYSVMSGMIAIVGAFAAGMYIGRDQVKNQMKENPPVIVTDVNHDGTLDYIINDDSTNTHSAFISKGQTFAKAEFVAVDGVGFYKTPDGYYDFDGRYYSNNLPKGFVPDTSKK